MSLYVFPPKGTAKEWIEKHQVGEVEVRDGSQWLDVIKPGTYPVCLVEDRAHRSIARVCLNTGEMRDCLLIFPPESCKWYLVPYQAVHDTIPSYPKAVILTQNKEG